MNVGYARISARDQHIAAQLERLSHCERVFSETASGRKVQRPVLDECLEFLRAGDMLSVTRLDRLARSVAHLCAIAATLHTKGVSLVVLDQHIDTGTPTGVLLFHMLAAIAEFEVSLRKEQQRAGIAYARETGRRCGREPRFNGADLAEMCALLAAGHSAKDVAHRMRYSVSTINRYRRVNPSGLPTLPVSEP